MRRYADENDGNNWILHIECCYSKYIFSFPMLNKTAECVLERLKLVVTMIGPPRIFQSNNGTEFVNRKIAELLEKYSIISRRGRPRRPQNQGQVERANQTITRRLAKYVSDKSNNRWIDILDEIVIKYNTNRHRATNITPMEAFYGRTGNNSRISFEEELPEEPDYDYDSVEPSTEVIVNPVQAGIVDVEYRSKYLQRMVNDHDVHYRNIKFEIGDSVLISFSFDNNTRTRKEKLDDFYEEGIWTIIGQVGSDNYEVLSSDSTFVTKVVSKNRLKKIN